jgi:hypothetical protein
MYGEANSLIIVIGKDKFISIYICGEAGYGSSAAQTSAAASAAPLLAIGLNQWWGYKLEN